jgi:hypothetical protein
MLTICSSEVWDAFTSRKDRGKVPADGSQSGFKQASQFMSTYVVVDT